MYCDKDKDGRYSIMVLQQEELETIRRALTAYRTGLCNQLRDAAGSEMMDYIHERFNTAGDIARHIESILQPEDNGIQTS